MLTNALRNDHRLCVAYDNFQYYQRVGAERLGEFDDLRQYTTGKFYLGADMPEGGLRQDMLSPSIFLNDVNILDAQGNHYDDIQKQISNFFITEAIRQAYPGAVDHVFDANRTDIELDRSYDNSMLKMPEIDLTPTTTMGPINAEERSISGNHRALEDIFLRQLCLSKENDLSSKLYPIFGDLLTVSRLRSIQSERNEARPPYDRYNWLIQIPAFFHVRMNLLWLINKSHHGDPSLVKEYSSLNTHMHVLDRKKSSKGDPPFEYLEDSPLHSFYAALFNICISELAPSCDIHHPEAVDAYKTKEQGSAK
ncbi:hypothetical protein V8E54_002366 [Elaphomyces granulatus]